MGIRTRVHNDRGSMSIGLVLVLPILMLALGASRPWPEALSKLGGETRADASALLEYFAPLRAWLDTQLGGQSCGW